MKKWQPPPTGFASLASVSSKDFNLEMECAEAVGHCAATMKCDDLDASQQCVLRMQQNCSTSQFLHAAGEQIKKKCNKIRGCAECEEKVRETIITSIEQFKK